MFVQRAVRVVETLDGSALLFITWLLLFFSRRISDSKLFHTLREKDFRGRIMKLQWQRASSVKWLKDTRMCLHFHGNTSVVDNKNTHYLSLLQMGSSLSLKSHLHPTELVSCGIMCIVWKTGHRKACGSVVNGHGRSWGSVPNISS